MSIIVNTSEIIKIQNNFWNNLHFHPTDAIEDDWGKRILDEVARENAADVVRMYTMMEDIVTLKDGKLCYDFTLNDTRLDYMVKKGFRVILCYAFVPPFLATNKSNTSSVSKNKTRYKGKLIVSSYPTDFSVWQEICRTYTEHILERYGEKIVSQWYLQCYNEPDYSAFFMAEADEGRNIHEAALARAEQYIKLYDAFADGIALAEGKFGIEKKLCIGGPAIAGRFEFLDAFLKNAGEKGVRIDFVCGHSYGTHPPLIRSGEVPLDTENIYEKYLSYMDIVNKYFPDIDFIMDEWGACSAGFANKDDAPELMYRETEIFAAYYGRLLTNFSERNARLSRLLICLSGQHEMTEDFSGFRNFFSLNFIKKPIYNAYVAARKLGDKVVSHSALPEGVTLLATKNDDGKCVLLFTYSSKNFDKELPDITEKIVLSGVSGEKKLKIYRIDRDNINPYRVFCQKGYSADLTNDKIDELKKVATLKVCDERFLSGEEISFDLLLNNNCFILCEIE